MDASAREDLARLRAIAEQGRSVPLLGGWHLILWGGAMTLALLINWAVDRRILAWPGWSLAVSWFGIVLLAWIGTALLGRGKADEVGASSIGNQVERTAWTTAGGFLLILALALFARASIAGGAPEDWELFALMPPASFGAYAVALNASAVAAGGRSGSGKLYVLLSLGFAAITAFLIGNPVQHLAAAAGIVLVTVPAGLGHIRASRRRAI